MTEPVRVTVVGGGLAGLTAALRLAERGYRVRLYEEKSILGGNLASRPAPDGGYLDVYPHMYLNWYHNFWQVLSDVTGVERTRLFAPYTKIKQLRQGAFPEFTELVDMYSPWHMLENLFSGVGPVADMFVFGYASVDLLAENLNPTLLLHGMTLNGFLHARPYMTKRASDAYDTFITQVWAIPSKLASASDYRRFLAYAVADPSPDLWLARGPAFRQVIEPLTRALEKAGVEIALETRLESVTCTAGRVREIGLEGTRFDEERRAWVGTGERRSEPVDDLVLAVPPGVLSRIVRAGDIGHRVVDAVPDIAELAHLRSESIPIVHLYFTRKLAEIPAEPVGLHDSRLALAFTDISQTWSGESAIEGQTVLAVSSSDAYGLPGPRWEENAMAILQELAQYVDFEPGSRWGESPEIDWQRTNYNSNADTPLSVNESGTCRWRPTAACDGVANLWFAGDFCHTRIGNGMMTIELAVTSGLEAASAIVEARGLGDPVAIIQPRTVPDALFVALRYAWAPYVACAGGWSRGSDCVAGLGSRLADARSILGRVLKPTH